MPRFCAAPAVPLSVPLIGFAQAGGEGFFDDGGYPVGGGWDEVSLPEIADPGKVSGHFVPVSLTDRLLGRGAAQ